MLPVVHKKPARAVRGAKIASLHAEAVTNGAISLSPVVFGDTMAYRHDRFIGVGLLFITDHVAFETRFAPSLP